MRRAPGPVAHRCRLCRGRVCWRSRPRPPQSGERILDYRVTLAIEDDGDLAVTEIIAYDFGSNERRGIFREIPTRFPYDDEHERVYPIEDVTVTATPEGTPTDVQVTTEGNVTRIRIGDPDVFITGSTPTRSATRCAVP